MKISNTYYFSRTAILLFWMCYLINLMSGSVFTDILTLQPQRIFFKFEVWRLLSFPFAGQSFAELVLVSIALFVFGHNLERSLSRAKFGLLLSSFIVFQGLIYSALFFSRPAGYTGVGATTFFLIALSIGLSPREYILIFNRVRLRFIGLTFIIVSIFFASTLLQSIRSENIILLNGAAACFGLVTGFITAYFITQIQRIRQEAQELSQQRRELNYNLPPIEEYDHAVSTKSSSKVKPKAAPAAYVHEHYENDEEHLNYILDKILENGEKSLSSHDREFLAEYSRKL